MTSVRYVGQVGRTEFFFWHSNLRKRICILILCQTHDSMSNLGRPEEGKQIFAHRFYALEWLSVYRGGTFGEAAIGARCFECLANKTLAMRRCNPMNAVTFNH